MKINRGRLADLDASLVNRWRQLQTADAELGSPYFCVEYARAVSEVRPNIEVAVLEFEGQVRGFFPYEPTSRRVAGPVGGRLSDWHGLIAEQGLQIDAQQLMRACGKHIWDFDHVPASQVAFASHTQRHDVSPIMDLTQGYGGYLEQRKKAGAQRVSQMLRKARKFEREVGALRFEANSHDPKAFAQVVQWKREQCQRTGVPVDVSPK